MPAGIQVRTPEGIIQIDDSTRAYCLRNKGVAVTQSTKFTISGGNVTYVLINLGAFNGRPIVAVNCGYLASTGATTKSADGTWKTEIYVRGEIGTSISWFAFDYLQNSDMGRFGLSLWDAAGRPAYDSSNKAIRVVSSLEVSGATGGEQKVLAQGKSYAVVLSVGGQMRPVAEGNSVLLTNGVSVNGNVINAAPYQIEAVKASSVSQNRASYGLIIDVTDY